MDHPIRISDSDNMILVNDRNRFLDLDSDEDAGHVDPPLHEKKIYERAYRMVESQIPNGWKTRRRQSNALYDAQIMGVFVFAIDNRVNSDDQWKTYAAASLRRLHDHLISIPRHLRNVYELLRENVPSKFYVDCDVRLTNCPDFDGKEFDRVFELDIREFLSKEVHFEFGSKDITPLLRYDSSNEQKWSRHYLIHGAMFLNTYHVGAIIRRFRTYVVGKYGHPDKEDTKNPYFIPPKKTAQITDGIRKDFIIDMGVYTKYRVFRLPGNRKFGKTTVLVPVNENTTVDESTALQASYTPTLAELLRGIIQDPILALTCKIHSVLEENGSAPTSIGISRQFESASTSNTDRVLPVSFFQGIANTDPNAIFKCKKSNNIESRHRDIPCHPRLAGFLCQMINNQQHVQCVTRGSRYYPDNFSVTINSHSRACSVKQGDHTNRCVYYVVNLIAKEYIQKCFSSTCRGIAEYTQNKSGKWPSWPIPDEYHAEIEKFMNSIASTQSYSTLSISKLYCTFYNVYSSLVADPSVDYRSEWYVAAIDAGDIKVDDTSDNSDSDADNEWVAVNDVKDGNRICDDSMDISESFI